MRLGLFLFIALNFITTLNAMTEQDVKSSHEISQQQAVALQEMIKKNDIDGIKKLLQAHAFDVDGNGLSHEIRYNFSEIVIAPLEEYQEKFSTFMSNKLTPLLFAAIYAHPKIIHNFLQANADPNQSIEHDGMLYYPLTIAYSSNYSDFDKSKALIDITKEFLQIKISQEHLVQARNFVDTTIKQLHSSQFANRLRKLFDAYAKEQAD